MLGPIVVVIVLQQVTDVLQIFEHIFAQIPNVSKGPQCPIAMATIALVTLAMATIALVTLVGWLASPADIPQELAYLGKGYHTIFLGDRNQVGSDRLDIPPRTIKVGSNPDRSMVHSVQWHPDGATFVSGSSDKMVRDLGRHQRQLLEDLDRSHQLGVVSGLQPRRATHHFWEPVTIPSRFGMQPRATAYRP